MGSIFRILKKYPLKNVLRQVRFRLHGRVVSVSATNTNSHRGWALLSYTTFPFTLLREENIGGHTSYWEVREMVRILCEYGYSVDIIDFDNHSFLPQKDYKVFIDICSNLGRLNEHLSDGCLKIFHTSGSHWLFQNRAEYSRLAALKERKGVTLPPARQVPPMLGLEHMDILSGLAGPFPASTYAYLDKPTSLIPLSTTHTYDRPTNKNITACKKSFLWFGGAGAVHKGLDLVLEAFAQMPDFTLYIGGKPVNEAAFAKVYHKELFETPNIKALGHIDPGSAQFKEISDRCIGIIYPSCSEGTASSVIIPMHAGLIPVVTKESGIVTGDFGVTLTEATIPEINAALKELSLESDETLHDRALRTWQYARDHHTREQFTETYQNFVAALDTYRS